MLARPGAPALPVARLGKTGEPQGAGGPRARNEGGDEGLGEGERADGLAEGRRLGDDQHEGEREAKTLEELGLRDSVIEVQVLPAQSVARRIEAVVLGCLQSIDPEIATLT